jgi:short-subunit dehydrogenase
MSIMRGAVHDTRSGAGGFGAERFGYLVNNAGTSHDNSFEKTTEEEMEIPYNVDFKSVFFLSR